MNAGEDLDESRFACAVFAKQGVETPYVQTHVDVAKRQSRPEGLGDVAQFEKRGPGGSNVGLRAERGGVAL